MTTNTRRVAVVTGFAAVAGAIAVVVLGLRPSAASAHRQEADGELPFPVEGNVVRQGFPARRYETQNIAGSDTAWVVQWEVTNPTNGRGNYRPPSSVLRINSAKFMYKDKNRQPRWITVLRNLEVSEIFVPYDPGFPRYRDVTSFAFHIQPADQKLLGPPCVGPGEILTSADPNQSNKVYKELHDDGVRWLADSGYGYGGGGDRGRRGEKMLLWVNFYGANYRYLMEYAFHDEGSITCRVGGTARNLLPRQADNSDVHLHVGCWVFEPDLGDPTNPKEGGPKSNVVQLVRRMPLVYREPGSLHDGRYRVDVRPFGTPPGSPLTTPALEGSAEWVPEEFTTLRIESTVRKNRHPKPLASAYDLMPIRSGTVRHFPQELEAANKDFWVTGEVPTTPRYFEVTRYVQNPPRAIDKKPVVVFHNSPLLHVPRAEDLAPNGVSNYPHVALTSWTGFTLRPRNLFDSTPLFEAVPEPES